MKPLLYIHGIGHFHPENVITNRFLEDLDIGTSCHWIEERLGIRERRTVLDLNYIRTTRNQDIRAATEASQFSNADTGERAARMAISRARIDPASIGLILSGSSNPEHSSPPEACTLANRLGISPAAFDVNSACNSFLTQASVAASWLTHSGARFGLLAQVENFTRSIDYRERTNCSLMGDATTAVVVSTSIPSRFALHNISIGASTQHWEAAVIPSAGHFRQKAGDVRDFALRQLPSQIDISDEALLVFHQANLRILEAAIEYLGVPRERHLYNVDRYGNCAGAGSVSVLSENWDGIQAQEKNVSISTVGAGLTYGSGQLRRTGYA